MQYREPRSPIVLSESDSSDEASEDDANEPQSIAIGRVVSEILGRNSLDETEGSLFGNIDDVRRENVVETGAPVESPVTFQEKNKSKDLTKKDKGRMDRKDGVSTANLTKQKIKAISKYVCCDALCLIEFGRAGVSKQRKYYFGLTLKERNVLLRGCLNQSHGGQTGYVVNGISLCREGFKKLYSLGNDRLQRVAKDIFCQIMPNTFTKEKSTTQLALEQWLNNFFSTNVESLPHKDIFHLADNWTKFEVFDSFRNETVVREEATLTYSWFCRIWKLEFPRVRIPKRSRFSTCAPCTEFKALRDKATLEADRSKLSTFLILEYEKRDLSRSLYYG
jgi:hypothetical protein